MDVDAARFVPIVMAGGTGTRLWPVSRESLPKQFVPLLNGSASTFQETVTRVSGADFAPPIILTANDFRFTVAEQLRLLSADAQIVLEPVRRDSAPAVAVGALLARKQDPDAICFVLASDHYVSCNDAFGADCRRAAELAAKGHIVTFGIRPEHPSSAYGYIRPAGTELAQDAWAIEAFVEKPDTETAKGYVSDGYLWNSGNFAFLAQTMIDELAAHAPDVLAAAERAVGEAQTDLDFLRLDEDALSAAPAISIDYAVMEKTERGAVLSASFGWSDLGTWDSLHRLRDKDAAGNVTEGNVVLADTQNSLVVSDDTLTAVLGMEDVVVVTTQDAVLVANMASGDAIKALVGDLKKDGRREAQEHLRMHRPWGWYERIDIGDRFQVKHICVKPGGKLSLQKHHHRAEHWVVVHGTAEVTIDDEVRHYHENEAAYLPIGCVHRLHNPGKIELKLIEVQVGSYTGEDDIVRIEDVYARD